MDYVLSNDARAVEAFRPSVEASFRETLLDARETEGETQGQFLDFDLIFVHECGQAFGDVVKQLSAFFKERRLVENILSIKVGIHTCVPEPSIMLCGMAKIFDCIWEMSSLSSMRSTRKLVPPKSSARNLPLSSVTKHNSNLLE